MAEGGNIIRIIGGKSEWIAEEEFNIIATKGDVVFSSPKRVNLEGIEGGREIGVYNWKEEDNNDEEDFPTAWWSYDYEGKKRVKYDKPRSNFGYRAHLEQTIYFQLTVNKKIPTDTSIVFKLWDYDTGLFMDWVNPDDDEFGGKEVKVTGTVREIEHEDKKRITLKLYLPIDWMKEMAEDRGSYRDGCLDFYWSWEYKSTSWSSDRESIHLKVYPSEYKLRIKPASKDNTYSLPEIYSHKGDFILFAIDQLPNGEIQKFVSIKLRNITTFKSIEGINKFRKEVFSETIDLTRNRLESSSFQVEDVEHIFKVKKGIEKIFVEEEIVDVPVARGTDIAFYNSVKKVVKFGKKAANFWGHIQVLDEMRNMIPELSSNGQFNKPSLSTFIGFIPGAQVIAFGVSVLEWIAMDMIREMDEWVDEQMWISWQNAKHKGLATAKSFCDYNDWASKNGFLYDEVSQKLLNRIIKGDFQNIDDLISEADSESEPKTHVIFSYRVELPEVEDYFDIVDCIFINDENEKNSSMFNLGF